MKNLRLYALLACCSSIAFAGLVAACSSDDDVTTSTPDGGPEASKPDTGGGTDSGGGTDTGTDAPFDGGIVPTNFSNDVANAICNALTRCCYGNANVPEGGAVDGGTFDRPECLKVYKDLGFQGSLVGNPEISGGKVEIDQTKGAECLQKINTMQCNINGTDFKAIRKSCFDAVKGKVAAGQPCKGSIECAPGTFCNPTPDAGFPAGDSGTEPFRVPGTCTALKANGQPCSVTDAGPSEFIDSLMAEYACSYRAGGDTNLRCASADDAGNYLPRDEWKCAATVGNEQYCNSSAWCADGVCDPESGYVCKSPIQYFNSDNCTTHLQ
jgi:hypothetical protein